MLSSLAIFCYIQKHQKTFLKRTNMYFIHTYVPFDVSQGLSFHVFCVQSCKNKYSNESFTAFSFINEFFTPHTQWVLHTPVYRENFF